MAGLQAMPCWSGCMLNWPVHELPPFVDSSSSTPAANTWDAAVGSTHSRPNHHPYVACEPASPGSSGRCCHVSPPSIDRYRPWKSPLVSITMAYRWLGSDGARASPIRPMSFDGAGRPLPRRSHVSPPSTDRYTPDPTPP